MGAGSEIPKVAGKGRWGFSRMINISLLIYNAPRGENHQGSMNWEYMM